MNKVTKGFVPVAPAKRVRHDYGQAQALIAKGVRLQEVAETCGINYHTLKNQCARKGWIRARRITQDTTKDLVVRAKNIVDWKAKAADWRVKLAALLDKRLDMVTGEHSRKMDLDELEKAGRIIDLLDRTQRRQMGIEDGTGVNMQIISKSVDIRSK